jgi:hypothetical protein
VQRRFPGEPLVISKSDMDSWYKRLLLSAESSCLLATLVVVGDQHYVLLFLVMHFGIQEASYAANFGSMLIHQKVAIQSLLRYGILTGSMFSDDFVTFNPRREIPFQRAVVAHSARLAVTALMLTKRKMLASLISSTSSLIYRLTCCI